MRPGFRDVVRFQHVAASEVQKQVHPKPREGIGIRIPPHVNHAVHADPCETATRLVYVNGHRRILVIAFRFGVRILDGHFDSEVMQGVLKVAQFLQCLLDFQHFSYLPMLSIDFLPRLKAGDSYSGRLIDEGDGVHGAARILDDVVTGRVRRRRRSVPQHRFERGSSVRHR